MKGESGGNATSWASMMLFLLANNCYETNPLQTTHLTKKNNTQSEEEVVSIGRNQLLQFPYLGGSFDEKWWQQQDMQKQNHQNTPFKMSWVASKTSWKWFTTSLKKWKVVKELKNPFGVMIDLRASLFGMDGSPFSMRVANPPSKVPSRSKVFAILFGLRVKNFVFVAH